MVGLSNIWQHVRMYDICLVFASDNINNTWKVITANYQMVYGPLTFVYSLVCLLHCWSGCQSEYNGSVYLYSSDTVVIIHTVKHFNGGGGSPM